MRDPVLAPVISVRFGPEQAWLVRTRAKLLGLTVSGYLRHVVSREVILSRPDGRQWRADNGAEIVLWTNAA